MKDNKLVHGGGVSAQQGGKCPKCGRELEFSPITLDLKCPSCEFGAFFGIEVNEKFVKQNLKKIVLSLLEQQPLSGYDVIKVIFQRFNTPMSHGRVYPLLYSLEGQGLLKGETEAREKKVYSLTQKGIDFLKSKSDEFVEIKKQLGLASPQP